MKFILAEKKEMTQKFDEAGKTIPVTKVIAKPCIVAQIKTADKNGYTAVQIGCGLKKNLSKSVNGHLKNLGNVRYLREFRTSEAEAEKLKVGDKITAQIFKAGDSVKVTGVSKGKGFQGVVRRHGFHGSPASHGHKDQLRMPGSIGATGPAHVFKGKKMPGRMGGGQVTVTNLEIIEVDLKNNEIFIKGAVPGPRNNLLLISGVGDLVIDIEEPDKPDKSQIKPDKKPARGGSASGGEEKKDEEKPKVKTEDKPAKDK
jgi:large subunit ribosomal protein L3